VAVLPQNRQDAWLRTESMGLCLQIEYIWMDAGFLKWGRVSGSGDRIPHRVQGQSLVEDLGTRSVTSWKNVELLYQF